MPAAAEPMRTHAREGAPSAAGSAAALAGLGLAEAARHLRRGELRAEDYAAALLQVCARGGALNAFTVIDPDAVMDAARRADAARAAGAILGPLHGVPLAIKDNINTSGLPTSGGTASLRGHRPASDAAVVTRIRQAGAIVLGKTNLHELAMGWTGNNPVFGQARNPHAPDRIAGGSSSGSAAAVAAGMAPAAIGSDTNGSIRIPAALCGVVGLRPTLGRYPTDGLIPLSQALDTVGPMARSVADVALLDAVMRGAMPPETPAAAVAMQGVRLGLSPELYLSGVARDVRHAFDEACRRLVASGAELVTADIPDLAALSEGVAPAIIHHDAAQSLAAYLARHAPEVSLQALVRAAGSDLGLEEREAGLPASEAAYHGARLKRARLQQAWRAHFAGHRIAALIHPVVRMPAPPIASRAVSPAPDVTIDGRVVPAREAFGRNVAPASLAGAPGLVLPAGRTPDGLPVGIGLDAQAGGDDGLLQLGLAIEAVLGSAPRPAPDLSFRHLLSSSERDC